MEVDRKSDHAEPFAPRLLRIGSYTDIPVVLAPMAGVTDFPFREVVRFFGAGLTFSEMTASRAVIESFKNKAIQKRMRFLDASKEKIAVQLVGYDPDIMAEAARFNEQLGAVLIDINMGCPVKKVVNTDAGAALMKDEKLAAAIMASVVRAVSIPVTVKMRLGWDSASMNAAQLAHIAEDCGVQCVTVHARTRAQFYEGKASWPALKPIKEILKTIPLIGNGDVQTPQEALSLLQESGADAVMIGRGTLGRPWLICQVAHFLETGETLPDPTVGEIFQTIQKHLSLIIEEYGEEKGVLISRKHISWYSKGFPGAAEFRSHVNAARTYKEIQKILDDFFSRIS